MFMILKKLSIISALAVFAFFLIKESHAQNSDSQKPATESSQHYQPSSSDEKYKSIPLQDVQRFTTAISQIKQFYVDKVSDQELFEHAIRGMLEGLDPHSSYLDEEEFEDLHTNTSGEFGGLGIEVTMDEGVVKVISPIDDTPAHKAGIKAGDYIVRIDAKPVKGMKLKEAVSLMRGKKGSEIKLTILRKGENKPLYFTLVRDIIQIQSVKFDMLEDQFAYIRISHFQSTTSADFLKAIKSLKKQAKNDVKGLIIDLRNNPGGLLDSAIEISDILIHNDQKDEEEMIVYTKGRLKGSEFQAIATPGDMLKGAPIVVLINEGSASGSEIVAGALKDNNRAILVGQPTFGKGSVQTILPLDAKRGIKLTTALYYTPSGRSIQAKGLKPDIIIEEANMPEKEKDELSFLKMHEADLKGHLIAEGQKEGEEKALIRSKLLEKDYQLNEALKILKAMKLAARR